MDTAIVVIIVGWAVFALVRRYVRLFRPPKESTCACGCSGCSPSTTCPCNAKSSQGKP
jgi:hypothetical protein